MGKHSLHIILPDDITFQAWKDYMKDHNRDPNTNKYLSQNNVFINLEALKPYLPPDYKLDLTERRGKKKVQH